MKTFSLEIGNLDFSVEECNYREINCIIMNLWEEEKNDFLSQISEGLEIKDRDRCIARLHSIGKSIIDECIREGIVKTLVNNHIYIHMIFNKLLADIKCIKIGITLLKIYRKSTMKLIWIIKKHMNIDN